MSYRRIDSLSGQVAVIVGATGGMGFATAKRLAEQGARIVGIVRRNKEKAEEMFATLPNQQLNHFLLLASIDDSVSLIKAAHEVKQQAGRCDILVNTAGTTRSIPHVNLDALSDDVFDEIMKINVRGVFSTIKVFTPLLKETGQALIVNITSAAGIRTGGSNIAYAASKAALDSVTRNLSKALAPSIRVVSLAPSAVDTNFLPNRSREFLENAAKATPLGRIGEVDDIASMIEALATTIRFTTGNCFVIDGGRTV
jgi:NAD(P)-dependent dehydrogenase (short-subunit alcohol dehydrogenase family)